MKYNVIQKKSTLQGVNIKKIGRLKIAVYYKIGNIKKKVVGTP